MTNKKLKHASFNLRLMRVIEDNWRFLSGICITLEREFGWRQKRLEGWMSRATEYVTEFNEHDRDGIYANRLQKLEREQGGRIHRTKNIITPEPLENDFEISRRKAGRIAKELMQGDDAGEVLPKLAGYRVTETGTFYNEIDGHFYIKILLKKAKKTGGGVKNVQIQRRAGKPDKRRPGGAEKAKKQQANH